VLDQPLELLEARLRGERGRLLWAPQHADHPPHLGERLPARLLDDEQGLALLLLVGAEQATNRRRLHGHHADAVPDDVVQLARDPRPLVRDGESCPLLPLALGPLGPLLRLVNLPELAADREPDDPGDREDGGIPGEVCDASIRVVMGDDRRNADREGQAGDCLGARRTHTEENAQRDPDQKRDEVVRDEPVVDERACADGDTHGQRRAHREPPSR
jgi:hypothetical protein